MLIIGAVLGAFATLSAGQGVFADSVEPRTVEGGLDTSARCNPEDIMVYGPSFPRQARSRVRRIQEKRARLRERAPI